MSLEEVRNFAKDVASSGMFGITKPEQAVCLMMICQSEGIDPVMALRRYHLIEGKPSMRADAMQGEFMARGGAIIWHVRTDDMVAATFFADKAKVDDAARDRAADRFDKMWKLDNEDDAVEHGKLMIAIAKISRDGEETVIRTLADANEKKLSMSWKWNSQADHSKGGDWKMKTNWQQSPRQMLTARVISEGVRLINPGLIAGIYPPDEVEDIVRREREEHDAFVDGALAGRERENTDRSEFERERDIRSMEQMIVNYHEEAKTASGNRKQELLGLASELRCQIDDLRNEEQKSDEIPGLEQAKPIETELLPPEKWEDYVLTHVKSKVLRGKKLGGFDAEQLQVIAGKTSEIREDDPPGIKHEKRMIFEAAEAAKASVPRGTTGEE